MTSISKFLSNNTMLYYDITCTFIFPFPGLNYEQQKFTRRQNTQTFEISYFQLPNLFICILLLIME